MWNWILASVLALSTGTSHKFYFSNTDLHVNRETQALEISVRTFTDDTERALMEGRTSPLRLGDERQDAAAPALLEAYLKEHLILLSGTDTLNLAFVGFEVEGYDLTWSYLECPLPPNTQPITIHSTLFLELFDEQINSVDCDVSGTREVIELHRDRQTHTFRP